MNRPALLSTLWIVLFANFVYCDVLGFYEGALLTSIIDGRMGDIEFGPGMQLAGGVLMQIPIGMILLSRVLPRTAGRVTNIVAGSIMILVQLWSLTVSDNAPVYIFFSVIEVALLVVVIVAAVTWKKAEIAASTLQPSTV